MPAKRTTKKKISNKKLKSTLSALGPTQTKFWDMEAKLVNVGGRNKVFETPENLWLSACEYFQWLIDNPLYELKAFATSVKKLPVMRAATLEQLCLFLGVSHSYFRTFKSTRKDLEKLSDEDKHFLAVIEKIEGLARSQKFQGAAAGLLNATMISYDLGMAKKEPEGADETLIWKETKTYTTTNEKSSKKKS